MASWLSDPLLFPNPNIAFSQQLSDSSSSSTASVHPPLLPAHLIPCPIAHPPPPPPLTAPAGPRVIAKRKRKSRALKTNLTTYISTDAANFRQMVQHVTGLDFDFPDQPPPVSPPQPDHPPADHISAHVLPTLDTSAFLLDRKDYSLSVGQLQQVAAPASHRPFQMDPLNCFPTLESWTVV